MVMCTRGRQVEIEAFLESLLQQRRRDIELVVVDQNDDDRLMPIISRFSGEFRLLHLHMEGSGAARARNFGLNYVTGDLVGFPDDDCRYLPDYLNAVDHAFSEDPALGAITGQPTAEEAGHDGESLSGWQDVGIYTVQDRCQEFTIWLRRKQLGALRYNERMGVGANTPWGADEGPEFLIRFMQKGFTVRYYPRLFVYHPNKIIAVSRKTLARAASYARGRGCLLRLHRFPARIIFNTLLRAAAGGGLYLATVRPLRSAYYFTILINTFRGLMISRSDLAYVEKGSRSLETLAEISR